MELRLSKVDLVSGGRADTTTQSATRKTPYARGSGEDETGSPTKCQVSKTGEGGVAGFDTAIQGGSEFCSRGSKCCNSGEWLFKFTACSRMFQ